MERKQQIINELQTLLEQMDQLVETAKAAKPDDRTERDRYFAIWITELEKAQAFFLVRLYMRE